MLDVLLDTIIDALKLLPFLFLTFLLMEYIEHKLSKKSQNVIEKAGKFGPLIGGLLGAIPQCGFSVAATNFYAMRILSIGTLIAIYLSTSDEMLPIMLSNGSDITTVLKIVGLKLIIGVIIGFIIDFIFRFKKNNDEIKHFCNEEHCDCEHGILKASLIHTFNILAFIFLISFILNLEFYYLGEDNISKIFMKNSFFGPFLASLLGLIPNCGASVLITELYLNGVINLGSTIAGLLTGSGVAFLVLFKVNENVKENIYILLTVYGIGALCGIIINFLGIML